MEAHINRMILVGRVIGSEPLFKTTKSGVRQATFTVGTTEVWRNGRNERCERRLTHRIVCYGAMVNAVDKVVRVGCLVYIEGSLLTRKWLGKDGASETWTSEVVVDGRFGRLTVLHFGGELARKELDGYEPAAPMPDEDDIERLPSWLAPDDNDRSRLRSASDMDRRGQ